MRRRLVALGLSNLLSCGAAQATSGAEDFRLRWEWAAPHGSWKNQNISTYDIDGDGVPNLLTPGCFDRCWIAHERGGGGLRQLASSPAASSPFEWFSFPGVSGSIDSVLAFRANPDRLEIGTIVQEKVLARTVPLETIFAVDGVIADLDGDLDLEILVIDSTDLFRHDFDSGLLEFTRHGFGGSDLAVGQLDLDTPLEIVVASWSGSCWMLDGATLAVEWGSPSGCGGRIELAQVLPDTPLEILTLFAKGSDPFPLRLFDPPALAPAWTVENVWEWINQSEFTAGDFDPEDGFEILVTRGVGTAELLRGSDGTPLRSLVGPQVGFVGKGDLDADGRLEVLLGQRMFSPRWPLRVLDPYAGEVEDVYPVTELSNAAVSAGDVDGDGDYELVVGGSSPLDGDMKAAIHFFAGATGGGPTSRIVPASHEYGEGSAMDVVLGNASGDDRLEVLLSYDIESPFLACLDAETGTELWHLQSSDPTAPLLLADIVGDGTMDLITGKTTTSESSAVSTFRADLGWLVWQSPDLFDHVGRIRSLCHGHFEGASEERIAAFGVQRETMQMLDATNGDDLGAVPLPAGISDVTCANLDDDGALEIIASRWDGALGLIDPLSGDWDATLADLEESLRAVESSDFLGNGSPQIAVVTEGSVRLLEPSQGATLASLNFSGEFPYDWRALTSLDLDGDGRVELVVRTLEKLMIFGTPSLSPVLLVDGFESGDAALWTAGRP